MFFKVREFDAEVDEVVDDGHIIDKKLMQRFGDQDLSNGVGLDLRGLASAVLIDVGLAQDVVSQHPAVDPALDGGEVAGESRQGEVGVELDVPLSGQGGVDEPLDHVGFILRAAEPLNDRLSRVLFEVLVEEFEGRVGVVFDDGLNKG